MKTEIRVIVAYPLHLFVAIKHELISCFGKVLLQTLAALILDLLSTVELIKLIEIKPNPGDLVL